MLEYDVLKMGSSHVKNKEFLNKKVAEGWKLISVTQVASSDQLGNDTTHVQAYLEREVPDPKKESDGQSGQLITG